jgi:hypothetical protein
MQKYWVYSNITNQAKYPFALPEPPLKTSDFVGKISEETFEYQNAL